LPKPGNCKFAANKNSRARNPCWDHALRIAVDQAVRRQHALLLLLPISYVLPFVDSYDFRFLYPNHILLHKTTVRRYLFVKDTTHYHAIVFEALSQHVHQLKIYTLPLKLLVSHVPGCSAILIHIRRRRLSRHVISSVKHAARLNMHYGGSSRRVPGESPPLYLLRPWRPSSEAAMKSKHIRVCCSSLLR
jgi:hypothetical protein